jgi:hypothetical protein
VRLPYVDDVIDGDEDVLTMGEQPERVHPSTATRHQVAVVDARTVPKRDAHLAALDRAQRAQLVHHGGHLVSQLELS